MKNTVETVKKIVIFAHFSNMNIFQKYKAEFLGLINNIINHKIYTAFCCIIHMPSFLIAKKEVPAYFTHSILMHKKSSIKSAWEDTVSDTI